MAESLANRKNANRAIDSQSERGGGRINQVRQPTPQILEIINHFLFTADNGCLVAGIQDGYVVKIEKAEKFIISNKNKSSSYIKYGKPTAIHPLQEKILQELKKIQYGQLVIRLNNGKVEQIEITEKQRVNENEMEGTHGDGI